MVDKHCVALPDIDKEVYWEAYYAGQLWSLPPPSSFSQFVWDFMGLEEGMRVLDYCCGNGRDVAFFYDKGCEVTGVDASKNALLACRRHIPSSYVVFELVKPGEKLVLATKFDAVYSRFALHAMTLEEEDRFLDFAFKNLVEGGLLFIECRSIKDPLLGKGEVVSSTERIFGHYRRFIVFNDLIEKLDRLGFYVAFSQESNGLAVAGDDDPVVIRVIAKR